MADIIYRVFRKPYAISSISRTSNEVTVQISSAHDNLVVGQKIVIYGVTTAGLNTPSDDHEVITQVDSTTQFRYTRSGSDESDTDGNAGGHYGADSDGFIDWESTEGRNLVTADEIEYLEPYFDWATGFECNDDCLIDSFTTDSTRYVEINVPIADRHSGYAKNAGGDYQGFACYADTGFFGRLFYIQDAYTKVRGLICDGKSQTNAGGISCYGGGANETVEDCIAINFDGGSSSSSGFGIHNATHISNCEAHDCTDGFYFFNYCTNARAYYCTAVDCGEGFTNQNVNGTTPKCKNCRADSCTTDDYNWVDALNMECTNCADSDGSLDDDWTTVKFLATGTADDTGANKLIDTGADFDADGVRIGMRVKNTTDTTWANVTSVSNTELGLDADIFVSGESYEVGAVYLSRTFTYVDGANNNFMLASGDTGAQDLGIDLSADADYPVSDDVNGVTRPQGNYTDLGHNEVEVAGHPMSLRGTDVKGMRQWQPQTGRFLR